MNILIIGGAGFVGANLARRCLAELSSQVTVFDSLEPRYRSTQASLEGLGERFIFVQGDLKDEHLLQGVVQNQDVIFNCAGQTSHPFSMQQPLVDAEANCLGNLRLLESVRQNAPQSTVVFASSTTIVGKAAGDVIDEGHAERPCDIYSANKGVAEKYYQIYHDVYGVNTVSLRLPNLFGPFGKADPQFGFVNYFISLARAGKPITVYGDGQQRRNILYVEDATESLWQVANEPRVFGSALLAAGDEHPTILEIAEEIDVCFGGGGVKLVEWPAERRRIDVGNVELSSARLRKATGWRPRFDLAAGLQRAKDTLDKMPPEVAP